MSQIVPPPSSHGRRDDYEAMDVDDAPRGRSSVRGVSTHRARSVSVPRGAPAFGPQFAMSQFAPAPSRPKDAESRLERIHRRASERDEAPPALGRGDTGFGLVNRRKGWGQGAFVTSRKQDHPGSSLRGTKYTTIVPAVGAQNVGVVTDALRGKAPDPRRVSEMDPDSRRAAALIVGISGSENSRFAGAPKIMRGALRRQATEQARPGDFEDDFMMARRGGAQILHKVVAGKKELSGRARETLEQYVSSSSDEEERGRRRYSSDEEERERGRARRRYY
jgi:hypothetical protein